ncbi:MAG: hypothetical protein HQK51_11265, partial [Oligoflexia bacterium]|nr:hypothetical protein [Oligoflexia bacterium]
MNMGKANKTFLLYFLFLLISYCFIQSYLFAEDIISSEIISKICKTSKNEPISMLNTSNEVMASIQCNDNIINIKGEKDHVLELKGNFDQEINISADSVLMKAASFSKSLGIQAKVINIKEDIKNNMDFKFIADQLNLDAVKIKSDKFIFKGLNFNNSANIESNNIFISSKEIINNKGSFLTSKKNITLSDFAKLKNSGIIRSMEDVTFQGEKIINSPGTKIFANGVLRCNGINLDDSSVTIAREAALYFNTSTQFKNKFSLSSKNAVINSSDVNAGDYTKFYIDNNFTTSIKETAVEGSINFSGAINISQDNSLTDWINQTEWTLSPTPLTKNSAMDIQDSLKFGVYLTSSNSITGKSLEITSNQLISISGKYVDIQGKIKAEIVSDANVIIQSELAKVAGQIKAVNELTIKTKDALDISAKLRSGKIISLTSDQGSIHVSDTTLMAPTILVTAKDSVTIKNSTIKTATDLFGEKKTFQEATEAFNKLPPEEQAKYRLVIHSKEGDVNLGSNSVLRYVLADFKSKGNITRNGNIQGLYETLDGKKITEGGTIEVKSSNYKANDLNFTGFYKAEQMAIKDVKRVTFAKGSTTTADVINITQADDIVETKGSSIEGKNILLSADQVKIDGALTALATLGIKGTTIKIAGNVESKGTTVVESTNYMGIDGTLRSSGDLSVQGKQVLVNGLVAGMGQVIVNGSDRVKINGSIDSNGNTFITTGELSTGSDSKIKAQNVQLLVKNNIEHNGKIVSEKDTLVKLENGNFEKVRGSLAAGGWVTFDGVLSSDEAIKLVTGNDDKISSKGIQIITSEPIVINRNVVSSSGISIQAKNLTVDEGKSVRGTSVDISSTAGDVTLQAGSTISGTDSVTISAQGGNLVRKGFLDQWGRPVFSSIEAGSKGINLLTNGSYIDQASQTKTSGTLLLQAKNGLVIVPLVYITTNQQAEKGFFKNKTTTTTSTVYYNTTMEAASGLAVKTQTASNVTNWVLTSPNKKFDIFEGNSFTIKELHNSISSVTESSWRGTFRPLGKIIDEAERMAKDAKNITNKLVNLEQKIARIITKPITNNIPAIDKLAERFYKLQNVSTNFAIDLLNVKQVYKTDIYKKCFDGVKDEMVATIQDVQKLKTEFVKNIAAPVLKNISKDLSQMVLKMDKFSDKGINYVEAAASFENVARIAIMAIASTPPGGPATTALANVLIDKYIVKKDLNSKELLKSFSLGYAAGYGADLLQSSAAIQSLGQAGASMTASSARNVINDIGHVVVNDESYNSTKAITSILTGMATGAINATGSSGRGIGSGATAGMSAIGKSGETLNDILRASANSAASEAIFEVVEENRLNLDTVADRGLEGASSGLVSTTVTQKLTPEEMRKKLAMKMAETVEGFKQALGELLPHLESESLQNKNNGESADKTGLSEDQKASLDKFVKEQDAAIKREIAKKFGVESYDKLTPEQLSSAKYQEAYKCEIENANLAAINNPALVDIEKAIKRYNGDLSGRDPQNIVAAAVVGALALYSMYDWATMEPVKGHEGDGITSTTSPLDWAVATSASAVRAGFKNPEQIKSFGQSFYKLFGTNTSKNNLDDLSTVIKNESLASGDINKFVDAVTSSPQNRAAFEKYTMELRKNMQSPHVEDSKLMNIIKQQYR